MRFKNVPPCQVGDKVIMYVGSTAWGNGDPQTVTAIEYGDVLDEGKPDWFVWWNRGVNRWYWTDRCRVVARGDEQ